MKFGSEIWGGLKRELFNPFVDYTEKVSEEAKRRYEEYLKEQERLKSMPGAVGGATAGLTLQPYEGGGYSTLPLHEGGRTTSPITDPLLPRSPMDKTQRLPALPLNIPELPGPVAPVTQGIYHTDHPDFIDATQGSKLPTQPPPMPTSPLPSFEEIPGDASSARIDRGERKRKQRLGIREDPFAGADPGLRGPAHTIR